MSYDGHTSRLIREHEAEHTAWMREQDQGDAPCDDCAAMPGEEHGQGCDVAGDRGVTPRDLMAAIADEIGWAGCEWTWNDTWDRYDLETDEAGTWSLDSSFGGWAIAWEGGDLRIRWGVELETTLEARRHARAILDAVDAWERAMGASEPQP